MIEKGQSRWVKGLLNDLRKLGVLSESVRNETKEGIRKRMRELDEREWKRGMNEKSSLKIYREWRKEMGGQEEVYNNDQASEILFKCRTNNLRLNDRKRFWNEETACELCGEGNEDLKHFLLWCPEYREERKRSVRLQQPYIENEENIIGEYLFQNENIEVTKRTIQHFWNIREKKRKEKETIVSPRQ